METAQVRLDSDTLRTVQALTARMDCSVDFVVREAVRRLGESPSDNASTIAAVQREKAPADELVLNVPMPFHAARPVTVTIVRRTVLIPTPILPAHEETP